MSQNQRRLALGAAVVFLALAPAASDAKVLKPEKERAELSRAELSKEAVTLWRDPVDIGSRNLYYGPGGERDEPHGPFTFVEEDMDGTNPKYVVRDKDQVKWTVKLGLEARPETAASRLVWAGGYFANEDYFLEDMQIEGMPKHVKRGGDRVGPGGSVHAVRLKRHIEGEKKAGNWKWRKDQLSESRELNGLKVMMALINNWDLKDVNTAIYTEKGSKEAIYMVSDLGASFGAGSLTFPKRRSKDDLDAYVHSTFIRKVTLEDVDFGTPGEPSPIYAILWFPRFVHRTEMASLARHVPRVDAHWIGQILTGLSASQIHDAFRAAGYTPEEANTFTNVIQKRIVELNAL
jgi:hypothetical protein